MADREYPTIKPVELVERAIQNSSREGGTIFDPFAGSGTTLIACQRQLRKARLIEIDPLRADVICERWQQYTGDVAILDGNGRRFEEIARERRPVRDDLGPQGAGLKAECPAKNRRVNL